MRREFTRNLKFMYVFFKSTLKFDQNYSLIIKTKNNNNNKILTLQYRRYNWKGRTF